MKNNEKSIWKNLFSSKHFKIRRSGLKNNWFDMSIGKMTKCQKKNWSSDWWTKLNSFVKFIENYDRVKEKYGI